MIVHTHTPKAGLVGMLAAWLAKVPIRMHTVAGLPLMESKGLKKRLLQWVEKRTYSFATQVCPNSKGLKEYILEQNFTGVEKLRIIGNGSSNGIDLNYFKIHSETGYKPSLKEKFTIPSDDFTFIFVGRLVKDKGIVELVEAFVKLQKETPDVSLLLVGPLEQELDPLPGNILNIIHNHPKIFFTGYQEDVRPYFSGSDLLVFPSYREGFPNVILQALAMELPVIATDINGCNELIIEGHNGWIIPVKDSGILYATMKDAYFQRDKLWALKNNTRNSVLKYDRLAVWECLLKEYQHLLDGIS